eukprot:scaffold71094_cov66-Phaeocystis_antarctica.AAC.1
MAHCLAQREKLVRVIVQRKRRVRVIVGENDNERLVRVIVGDIITHLRCDDDLEDDGEVEGEAKLPRG